MNEAVVFLSNLSGFSQETIYRSVLTLLLIAVYALFPPLLNRFLLKRVTEPARRYTTAKAVSYILGITSLLILAKIWLHTDFPLATYLGILSAGLAVALQDPIVNLAAWLFIIIRQPFVVGDRVQIGDHAGDVVDQRLFMFSILEIGNWVDADQTTGRIIHIPNGVVFKQPVANYTVGFRYIWNELPVTVTFESDWKKTIDILQAIVDHHSADIDMAVLREIHAFSPRYSISERQLKPLVWVSVAGHGVTLTMRYLCPPQERRLSADALWRAVLDAFAKEDTIELAYPTQRFYDNLREGKPGAGGAPRNAPQKVV